MRDQQYIDGRRNGVKACIAWLHKRADEMNDPHAKAILNSAAFGMGVDMKKEAGDD
ncbi:translation initiation factor IF-1 [Rhodobacter sp. NTK016B]|uniref:translation initiation factor IF-1 n=1 Tax=Rhodobacter sp. NTK016B TaxID=2759676 RepID=UPI001A8C4FE2|nr:translation initiation factor IF-1 [Rhodobacter sp. NTK016B]MBN8292866.1 translation initiation factor IF-1 [Rhodobacter sp. NTK016B]